MSAFVAFALAALSATNPADPAAAGKSAAQVAPQPSPTRRYCFQYDVTGSILPQRTCKTLEEWKKDGIDPTARHPS